MAGPVTWHCLAVCRRTVPITSVLQYILQLTYSSSGHLQGTAATPLPWRTNVLRPSLAGQFVQLAAFGTLHIRSGCHARRATATATAPAPELVGLQRDEWPDFVAFFRGASAYVQVPSLYTQPHWCLHGWTT